MKKLIPLFLITGLVITGLTASAQQIKKPRPSPPDTVRATTAKGVAIEIAYSQPSVKGRTIGTDLAPYGKVWRLGANEATTIELSKNVKVEGKALAAGKYAVYAIPGEKEWTIMFNKGIKNWGTVYKEDEDVLRVTVKPGKSSTFAEQLKFIIDPSGKVSFVWGNEVVAFLVK
jgi:hypothetical protein